jgi:SAM-dependent methyltransferase
MEPIPVDNHLRHHVCPLCRSAEIGVMGALDYWGRARFSTCEVELSHVPELWRCRSCGSGFIQNAVDEPTARYLYSIGTAGDRWSTQPFESNKTRTVVLGLQALFRPGMRVLDVGANTGELLDFAQKAGCMTAALEYSDSSRSVLQGKGHASHPSFADVGYDYDIITAFDLVEHLDDVHSFLQSCHERMADGGRLVVLTGDIEAPSARLAAEHWWYVQYPEHVVFPSRTYLSRLPSFRLLSLHRTYASIGYKRTGLLGLAQVIRKGLQGRHYNGLPALGPDHILVILEKV